jgi:hypothetical protein
MSALRSSFQNPVSNILPFCDYRLPLAYLLWVDKAISHGSTITMAGGSIAHT